MPAAVLLYRVHFVPVGANEKLKHAGLEAQAVSQELTVPPVVVLPIVTGNSAVPWSPQ